MWETAFIGQLEVMRNTESREEYYENGTDQRKP